jgi:hypothetical protein
VGFKPTPQVGVVTAILVKLETMALACGIAFLIDGNEKEASWLAALSQTSVTHRALSSDKSLTTTELRHLGHIGRNLF